MVRLLGWLTLASAGKQIGVSFIVVVVVIALVSIAVAS